MPALLFAALYPGLLLSLLPAAADDGQVTLPLDQWERTTRELQQSAEPELPPINVAPLERRIDGAFRKGLFRAELVARFQSFSPRGHVRVPVLDSAASLGDVTLNGKRTSLLKEGDMYTVGIDQPGAYEVRARFFWGKEQDRFARRLQFRLPEAGPTSVIVRLPEQEIEARLAHGAIARSTVGAGSTEVQGQLDASGQFDLVWTRRPTHKSATKARLQARLNTVLTVHEALASGISVLDVDVLEGETDRVEVAVPAGVEVVRVEGDAVLQWHNTGREGAGISVLLRYLLEGSTRISVHFQYPTDGDKVAVRMPMPMPATVAGGATLTSGVLGVQAPAGLDVRAGEVQAAEALSARDFPPELNELTSSPLLMCYRFSETPRISLAVTRLKEVALTSTLIDELQASTVLIESGLEITKLKMRVRNNTRQYLSLTLPEGALLTHSLVDGQSVRPAVASADKPNELLVPLRQSEKTGAQRFHTVREGETLSDIANLYYSDPTRWHLILKDNEATMTGANDLQVGKQLRIPNKAGAAVEESSFVIELAYKRSIAALGRFGHLSVSLPKLDVDVVEATWHAYLSPGLTPLSFSANLRQVSALRYDPMRRLLDFFRLGVRDAWAGGAYKSILKQRRAIWQADVEKKGGGDVVLSTFPLVGEKFRFKRILLGGEQPHLAVTYVAREVSTAMPWLALLLAACAVIWLGMGGPLVSPRRLATGPLLANARSAKLVAVLGLLLLVLAGHFFLGVHRRILWGVDLGLIVLLVRDMLRPAAATGGAKRAWRDGLIRIAESPWTFTAALTWRNWLLLCAGSSVLWLILRYPLLLSTAVLSALLVARWRLLFGPAEGRHETGNTPGGGGL